MARLLTIAAVLLAALPEAFVQASDPNICSETPYAWLENYEPAQEWCSSYYSDSLGATPQVHCAHGDWLCSDFSELQAEAVKVLCSCIGKQTTTTTFITSLTAKPASSCGSFITTVTITPSVGAVTATRTVTITPWCSASTSTKTVTVTPSVSAATATKTVTITPSASMIAQSASTVTVTQSASTATVTLSASTATVTLSTSTATITQSASTATVTLSAGTATVTQSASTVTITQSASTVTTTTTTTTTVIPTCTLAANPPSGSTCNFNAIWAGITLFVLSAAGNTASSLSSCELQCLALSGCESISYAGTSCVLYAQSVIELELSGLAFPVDAGVAGSLAFYDSGCFACT